MHGAKYATCLGNSWHIWQQRFLMLFKALSARFCWNLQVAGNMRCIGCRINNSARWLIYIYKPYRAGDSNPNKFIIPLYMGIILIIYRLHVLLIPPLTAALTVHPILLLILLILPVLPPLFSLPSFCLISKELIFPPFIPCRLPHLLIGTLAAISYLPIFFLGVPFLALAVMVTAFQNNNLLNSAGDTLNPYLDFALGKGLLLPLPTLGERCNNSFRTFIGALALEIPPYKFNNVEIRRITWLFKLRDPFLCPEFLGIKIFIAGGSIFYKKDTWFYLEIFLGE